MSVVEQGQELFTQSQRYLLLKRFSFPTTHGSMDAISVTAGVGRVIQSLYTLMLSMIILEIWALIVLFGIGIVTRKRRITHNIGAANVAIWNAQSSPLAVAKEMLDYHAHIPRYALTWLSLAVVLWAGSVLMSAFVSPFLVIGTAAPVNPKAVFVPDFTTDPSLNSFVLKSSALQVPATLRAIYALESADTPSGTVGDVSGGKVSINLTQTPSFGNSSTENNYQIDYSYSVTGVDFGLQNAPDLVHSVEGSCVTIYDWYQEGRLSQSADVYYLHGDKNNAKNASAEGNDPPFVSVFPDRPTHTSNNTFSFIVSCFNRRSFTAGNDPWYLTDQLTKQDSQGATQQVARGRPVLYCWQNDLWTYKKISKDISNLADLKALSPALVQTMRRYLSGPMILEVTSQLSISNRLKSALTSQGFYIDAGSASMFEDMKRLILGSYILTKNILTETTLYDATAVQNSNIRNYILDDSSSPADSKLLPGAGDFVISNAAFATLSIKFMIVVPCVLAGLFLLRYILSGNTFIHLPWEDVNALKASVLYSSIDTAEFKSPQPEDYEMGKFEEDEDREAWKRSLNPYVKSDGRAHVRPHFHRKSGSYSWTSLPKE
jgi:hypothetical protein